jgi:ribosome-interacting GTPase 1
MPANLSPEFKNAQAEFRKARDPKDRLDCLREMLRTIPKHKGTEHLQADIKTRIKELTEDLAGPKKGGARGGPSLVVRPEGAAQVALLGPPNSGKSSLHAKLTGSHAVVGPYPFATKYPLPGMLAHEDIHFQLVDLPPVSRSYMEPWLFNALQNAVAGLLVMDLSDPECVEHATAIRERLLERNVHLLSEPAAASAAALTDEEALEQTFAVRLPTLLVVAKADQLEDPAAELETFRQLADVDLPSLCCSVESGRGLDEIGPRLFQMLGVVRVYTKVPGHPPETGHPYTLGHAETVLDVARLVHRGMAGGLKFARLWGSSEFDGQQVGADHVVQDGDIVELHW